MKLLKLVQKFTEKIDDYKVGDIKLMEANQTKTFMIMRKTVKVGNQDIHMSSNQLFECLISTVCIYEPPESVFFS